MTQKKLSDLLLLTKDGEWGASSSSPDHVEMLVIRGTDFPAVKRGDTRNAPRRFIPVRAAEKKRLQPNDVLIETAGGSKDRPTGRVVLLKPALFRSTTLPMTCASFSRFLRVNTELVDPGYLYWFLENMYRAGEMAQHQVQHTGVARFQYTRFAESTPIPLPPLPVQRSIARVLGSLDDKIELNRRMNETLEATARAIFKSWFVDYDPVRAKAEGRAPAGLDPTTAALFPDSFEDSELGEIPRGWRVEPLDSVADFLNGLALQKYPVSGPDSLPVIKISQLRQGHSDGADRAAASIPPDFIVNDGDVLFSWSGSLVLRVWSGGRGALNQHLFKVSSSAYPKWFYYFWIMRHLPDFQAIAAGKATTMGHIQRHHLSAALTVVPPANVLKVADKLIAPLFAHMIECSIESRTLAAIRDALLPRLLSGELSAEQVMRTQEAAQ